MRMEMVVDTTKEFNLIEEWLLKQTFPGNMNIDIFVMNEAKTYFYSTQQVAGQWILAAGEGE